MLSSHPHRMVEFPGAEGRRTKLCSDNISITHHMCDGESSGIPEERSRDFRANTSSVPHIPNLISHFLDELKCGAKCCCSLSAARWHTFLQGMNI